MSSQLLYKIAENGDSMSPGAKAILGAGAIKTLADFPKFVATGEVEKGIGQSLGLAKKGVPRAFSPASLKNSLRFARRASSGSLAGMLTFPLLAKGIKDASSDDAMKKTQGVAEVAGSGLTYSAIKGATEHGARHRMLSEPTKTKAKGLLQRVPRSRLSSIAKSPSMKPYLAGAVAKGIPGTLSALVPAMAVASGLKNKDEKASKSMARVGLAGAAASGTRGVVERLIFLKRMGMKVSPKVLKELVAAGGSKGAAGLLGGVLLDRVVNFALKKHKRDPQPLRRELEGQ